MEKLVIGGKYGQMIGHGKMLVIGLMIAAVGLLSLSLLRWSVVGVLLTMAVFGIGIGRAMVGNTNMISCACSKENFGSATAVLTMILMIGLSSGPVVASIIIGGFANVSTAYAYCWGGGCTARCNSYCVFTIEQCRSGHKIGQSCPA